ncbi:hypothetical protein COB21_01845 [Candidatus Aerophobetes bacterium]|uniref:Transporter n=1 Tax=Aerophobetes bacterium TaxID=2030807 RepID=A0A2A4X7N6_UNCAE|nr:MAG: hypothetical protein COB21_01845 [Candidatus Aerophobetes bacterium]
MKRVIFFLFFLTLSSTTFAYQNNQASKHGFPSLEELDERIKSLNFEYEKAAALFNPWYAGPLLTPSAHCVPPGHFNVQPYWFYTRSTSAYDSNGMKQHAASTTQNLLQCVFQAGIIDRVDMSLVAGMQMTRIGNESATAYQDTSANIGFQVLSEGHYRPAVRAVVGATFPTGKYHHLSPNRAGVQASGDGAYQLNLALVTSKVVWWLTPHPFQARFSIAYSIPSDVHVKGLNSYGGSVHTDGHEHVGNSINAFTSIEYSITQQWVFAIDFAYSYQNKSTFQGVAGIANDGTVAINETPSSYGLQIAPALEYDVSETFGILIGGETVLWGRNFTNASSAIVTFTYSW